MIFIYVSYAIIVIMSIVLHEIAHGWVAYKCGDDTAYLLGRLSLNPIRHIDPFMTILLPVICMFCHIPAFGGAKPVPVNPSRFRDRIAGERLVSLAGVAVNLAIAFLLAQGLRIALITNLFQLDAPGTIALKLGILTNIVLFLLNLTPIPPLDGSRFLRTFLPWEVRHVFDLFDRWGLIIVFVVVMWVPAFWGMMDVAIGFLAKYVILSPVKLW